MNSTRSILSSSECTVPFPSFSLSEIIYLSFKMCLIAFALLFSFASLEKLAAEGRKGLNAVNVKVIVTDNSFSIGDLQKAVLGVIQWYLPIEIRSDWFSPRDARISDDSGDTEGTKSRPRFKAGADLSGAANWFRCDVAEPERLC